MVGSDWVDLLWRMVSWILGFMTVVYCVLFWACVIVGLFSDFGRPCAVFGFMVGAVLAFFEVSCLFDFGGFLCSRSCVLVLLMGFLLLWGLTSDFVVW